MEKKSKVLIIGATGNLGYHLAQFSIKFNHPTFILVRDSAFNDPVKLQKLNSLSDAGATVLKGCLEDAENLVEALKLVDVVICSIPSKQVLDQRLLIKAIKEAGCIEKFIPSEFGADPDKVQISDMDQNFYSMKSEIRHLIEAEDIPYTYICCNLLMSYLLPSLIQPGLKTPPRDKVTVFGNGNVKGVFVKVEDVAAFTICAIDDPRTLNKVLYLRPSGNVYSLNELVEIWESKIGKKLDRIYVPEDQLLKKIKDPVAYCIAETHFQTINLIFI
ncbi:probable pinoresinol-lariciresinol reductase 3 isoform X2 [Hevea brasiliensis]|uniref:probable pinoresinol-lariciresinol reductase 3 isoform X2 n=1 Tax=Hevea brasiliensis TaxID=3981 RepID=UPI0025FE88B5|nr:probable pinoresinol-lariciresinol reductase 3 isoform X2 [Hevea brasiliensis]